MAEDTEQCRRRFGTSKLLSVQEWLPVVNIEVEMREPLAEELQEIRDFVASIPSP